MEEVHEPYLSDPDPAWYDTGLSLDLGLDYGCFNPFMLKKSPAKNIDWKVGDWNIK